MLLGNKNKYSGSVQAKMCLLVFGIHVQLYHWKFHMIALSSWMINLCFPVEKKKWLEPLKMWSS